MDWLDFEINHCRFFDFIFRNEKKLVLLGGARLARETIKSMQHYCPELDIEAVVDNNVGKENTFILGIPVISFDQLADSIETYKILITTRQIYQANSQCKNYGIKEENIFCFKSTFMMRQLECVDWILRDYQYARMLDIYFHKEEIENLYEQLADEQSRKVLKNIVKFRLTLEPKYVTEVNHGTQSDYFDDIPFTLTNEEVFLDIGGARGDSALEFLIRTDNTFEHIYLFEPDPEMLTGAMDNIFTVENRDKIHFFNMACSNANGIADFDNGMVNGGGDKQRLVRTIRLDDLFKDDKVTIIKMDVEGTERQVLEGGLNIIQKQNPRLCVCIYHKSKDLWEIPLFIKSVNSGYKIAIRQQSPGLYGDLQTVCYAY